jgi:hypothetical protein
VTDEMLAAPVSVVLAVNDESTGEEQVSVDVVFGLKE